MMKLSGRMLCRCFASVVLPEHVAPLTKKMDCQIRYCILHVSKTSRLERLRLYMHASTITISVPNADENNEGWRGFLCLDLPTVRRRRCRCRRLLERHSLFWGEVGGGGGSMADYSTVLHRKNPVITEIAPPPRDASC